MSIKKNFLYNLVNQVLNIIIPLITLPYIARTIGADGVGVNAFSLSIVQYFVIFGTLGTALYGNRSIAYVKNDKRKRSIIFWEISLINLIFVLISFTIFLAMFVFLYPSKYQYVFLLQSLYIISAGIDISWFFIGMEDIKRVVSRNLIIKVISNICIFIFVKSYDDLNKYIFLLAFSQFVSQLIMWTFIPKYLSKIDIKKLNFKKHILPNLRIFIPTIAVQIYLMIAKTMLGYYGTNADVGLYDMAEKITKMPLTIVTSLAVVMMPRISSYFIKKDYESINHYMIKSFKFQSYLAFLIAFGLMGCSRTFTAWFFGSDYSDMALLIVILSWIIIAISWSNIIGGQMMIPMGMENVYTVSEIVGCLINIFLNVILIPKYFTLGAVVASVVSQFSITFVQVLYIKKYFNFKTILSEVKKYLFAGVIMLCFILGVDNLMMPNIITTVIEAILGIIIYYLILEILKSDFNKEIREVVLKKLRIVKI